MNDQQFKTWIRQCEGLRLEPYLDSTGKATIGYGRNLTDVGISKEEAEILLDHDIKRTYKELFQLPWFLPLPDDVQFALANMCFNLGLPKLLTFKKMIGALKINNFKAAAREALNSEWAQQVGQRATQVALMISEATNEA